MNYFYFFSFIHSTSSSSCSIALLLFTGLVFDTCKRDLIIFISPCLFAASLLCYDKFYQYNGVRLDVSISRRLQSRAYGKWITKLLILMSMKWNSLSTVIAAFLWGFFKGRWNFHFVPPFSLNFTFTSASKAISIGNRMDFLFFAFRTYLILFHFYIISSLGSNIGGESMKKKRVCVWNSQYGSKKEQRRVQGEINFFRAWKI